MNLTNTLIFAVLGGIMPALLWLWFWLHEDRKNPEPKRLIAYAFIAGVVVVPLVLPFQKIVYTFFSHSTLILIILWAAIEEVFKFTAAYLIVLKRKEADEPIDIVIYVITTALGFVALENALFLFSPDANLLDLIITGNLRFIGASLLHVIASSTVGIAFAFCFFKGKNAKRKAIFSGLVVATALHSLFNFFIMTDDGAYTLIVFSILWLMVAALMLAFEKVKKLQSTTISS
jgi:RsiW-degrading membrane proteinase PrsW (M82 family)